MYESQMQHALLTRSHDFSAGGESACLTPGLPHQIYLELKTAMGLAVKLADIL